MKKITRKFMSLLMAAAIICSMAPAAMAYGSNNMLDLEAMIKYYNCMQGYHSFVYTYVNPYSHREVCINGCGYSAYANHSANCGCNVTTPSVPGYGTLATISQATMALNVGVKGSLSVSPLYSSAYYMFDSVVWQSSNPLIATVTGSGVSATVTGVAAGQAYITATVTKNNVVDTVRCLVTVGAGYGYNGNYNTGHFFISGSASRLDANGGYMLLSAVPYTNTSVTEAQLAQLQWSSSDSTVASVYSNTGYNGYNYGSTVYVYGGKPGTATITAMLDNTRYATYEVVVGGGQTNIKVSYSLTTGESLVLDNASFQNFWSEVTSDRGRLNYVVFGSAVGNVGQLSYKHYSGAVSAAVGSNAFYVTPNYSQYGISNVTFTPASSAVIGYRTGVLSVPFTAYGTDTYYSTNITSYSGTLKIYVAKEFADVTKGYSWASDYITRLAAEGIVNGVTATTYAPGATLKYGEALKLIMEATGTTANLSASGHWAKNYLDKAYAMGLVSTRNIDLQANISRDQVAELAAKALGLSKASVVTGTVKPTDSVNGYVYALYNAGILNGTTVNGKNYYYGSNTINRAEIAKIICLVSDYYAANK